jgi:tubulin---tyrosine ligase
LGAIPPVTHALQHVHFSPSLINKQPLPIAAFSLSSGTLGAALSSSLSGIRAIAISYGIVLRPTPKSLDEPAHRLSGRIINYLWNNWGTTDVLYSINIPMIEGLLDEEGLKIYWTSIWRNNYGRLFAPTSADLEVVEPKEKTFKGTDADSTSTGHVGAGSSQDENKLVFKFSPDLGEILKAESAPLGSDGWAIAQGAVSVTTLHASLAESHCEEFKTVQDRMWKMKL